MQAKQCFEALVLFLIFQTSNLGSDDTGMAIDLNAFQDNINDCLFFRWSRYGAEKGYAILKNLVECKKEEGLQELCYGAPPPPDPKAKKPHKAQFAICYNKNTRIPKFTGHVVKPGVSGASEDYEFHADSYFINTNQLTNEIALHGDYSINLQKNLGINFNHQKNQFCARGHLTPNADFSDPLERQRTFVTTNIAPQWQPFNGGNWAALESNIRGCATSTNDDLFVFTGTSGEAKNLNGAVIWLNSGRVLAPKYYWKAVCDPIKKQSIFFYAENNIGNVDLTKATGCDYAKAQTNREGVIMCVSISHAKKMKIFGKLPDFHDENCKPEEVGIIFQKCIAHAKFS